MNKLKQYWLLLQGKKTYIVTTVGGLLNLWLMLDPTALTPSQVLKVDALLIFLGGAALRSAVKKV